MWLEVEHCVTPTLYKYAYNAGNLKGGNKDIKNLYILGITRTCVISFAKIMMTSETHFS